MRRGRFKHKARRHKTGLWFVALLIITAVAISSLAYSGHQTVTAKSAMAENHSMDQQLCVLSEENQALCSQLADTKQKLADAQETITQQEQKAAQATAAIPKGKMVYVGKFTLTYYCGENYPHICGTQNRETKSGYRAQENITVSVDPSVIPLNAAVYIDGMGVRLAQDTGSAIKGNRIDVFVPTHKEAMDLGVSRDVDVWVIQ